MQTKFSVTKKDFEVTWFSGTGSGGQHRNKHQNCCRLKHIATGVITTGQSYRERPANQKEALTNMANNAFFKAYCNQKLLELEGAQTAEEWVDEQMKEQHLLIQVKDENGKWTEMKE